MHIKVISKPKFKAASSSKSEMAERQVPFKYFQNDSFKRLYKSSPHHIIPVIAALATTIVVLGANAMLSHHPFVQQPNDPADRPGKPKTDKDLSICAVLC